MMILGFTICLLFASAVSSFMNFKREDDEDRNTTELIRTKGYPCEEHDVFTNDGFILGLQRIPYGKNAILKDVPRPVALLQHGLLDASSSWVINSETQSLGFLLADAGFDVWLGNMRGNTYSLRHINLEPKDNEFWNFSWDEMSDYDLPAMVDYALQVSGQSQLFYIGHSQGTLIAFAQFAKNKELASKIKLFLALGPVSVTAHMQSPIRYLSGPPSTFNEFYYTLFGKKAFLPNYSIIKWLADKACNVKVPEHKLCGNILFVLCGPTTYLNASRVPVYITHDPAGTSVKNLLHFSQMVYSKNFQMFDYGSAKANILHYDQPTPPLYNVSKVEVPVALYWAEHDWLADPVDVQFLRKNLPNIVDDVYVADWNHLDFIWGINAAETIYYKMIALMRKYATSNN